MKTPGKNTEADTGAPMALASTSQTGPRARTPRDPRMSLAAFLASVRAEDEAHGGIRHNPECRGCND